MNDIVEVQLSRVIIQEKADAQYIHLRERDGERAFPIVIGLHEAAEIHSKLCKVRNRRPLTHDLIGNIVATVDWKIRRVVITDLKDATFHAVLVLTDDNGTERAVDCRPSDAIALAVQTEARIYVAKKVLDMVSPE